MGADGGLLVEALVAGRPCDGEALAEVGRLLAQGLAAAARAWPTLEPPGEALARFAAARLDPELEVVAAVAQLHFADLHLAELLLRGDARALEALEATLFREVEAVLAGAGLDASARRDVAQEVRRLVLVGDEGRPARLSQYTGRGVLVGWLKVVATRVALRSRRRGDREAPADDERLSEIPTPADAPELHFLKQKYGPAFKEAFVEAIGALPARERNLLRQSIIDGLSIDDLGRLYGAHRATAARWLQDARRALLAGTRERMIARVGVPEDECDSIMRLVHSQLDVTLRRLL